jgi:hypothetical protein
MTNGKEIKTEDDKKVKTTDVFNKAKEVIHDTGESGSRSNGIDQKLRK